MSGGHRCPAYWQLPAPHETPFAASPMQIVAGACPTPMEGGSCCLWRSAKSTASWGILCHLHAPLCTVKPAETCLLQDALATHALQENPTCNLLLGSVGPLLGYMSLLFIYVRIPLYQCSHLLLNVWHDCLACVKTWSDRVTKQAETKQAGT